MANGWLKVQSKTCSGNRSRLKFSFVFQTCDIKSEGRKRFLTLKNVQVDQAGEVSYQALNAVTTAMLTVKGTTDQLTAHL